VFENHGKEFGSTAIKYNIASIEWYNLFIKQ